MNEKTAGHPRKTGRELVASMPRDQLRSLFYLFSGKPDSRIRVFDEAVHLRPDDLVELHASVSRKLKNHSIEAEVVSVKVSYEGADLAEFGTWDEFLTHHWQEPEPVEEVVIKWDFLMAVEEYGVPQRHTLMLRVSKDIKPGKIIQMIASGNSDEFDQIDVLSSPAFCRVDFINAQISKELINEVSDWYKGRQAPTLIPDTFYWFKKKKQRVAALIHYSMPVAVTLASVAYILWYGASLEPDVMSLHHFGAVLLVGLFLVLMSDRVGHYFAARIYRALSKLEGSKVLFEFTAGDRKRKGLLVEQNRKQGRRFVRRLCEGVLVNGIFYGVAIVFGWVVR